MDTKSERHTSLYRLTDLGREQARGAGQYVRENITDRFDGYYVSEYIRALETAAHMGFTQARWQLEFYLREKDQGVLGGKSHQQRADEFAEQLDRLKKDTFYVAPPGGESVANSCLRVDRVLSEWRVDRSGQAIIAVCHGNIMSAFRVRLESLTQSEFQAIEKSDDVREKMHNGQILHYTRRDPRTGQIRSSLKWMKSVVPWDTSRSYNEWKPINRSELTNEELLDEVNKIPQLIRGDEEPGQAATLSDKPDD
jgi:broad specificity phosphatase PhoE